MSDGPPDELILGKYKGELPEKLEDLLDQIKQENDMASLRFIAENVQELGERYRSDENPFAVEELREVALVRMVEIGTDLLELLEFFARFGIITANSELVHRIIFDSKEKNDTTSLVTLGKFISQQRNFQLGSAHRDLMIAEIFEAIDQIEKVRQLRSGVATEVNREIVPIILP